jgi:hypothetical protein
MLGRVPMGGPQSELVMGGNGRFCRNHRLADARVLGSIASFRASVARHDPWISGDIRWDSRSYLRSGWRVDESTSRCNGLALAAQRALAGDFQIETAITSSHCFVSVNAKN